MPIISPMTISPLAQKGTVLNYNPATDSDVTMFINQRSGTSLVDTKGNNATILTPTVYLSGTTSYFRVLGKMSITGGSAWDVVFRFKLDDKALKSTLIYSGGSTDTEKGLTIHADNGNIVILSCEGIAYTTATIAAGLLSNTEYTIRFQWDGTTASIATITVNGTSYTTTTIKGWTGSTGVTNTYFGRHTTYFKGYYRSVVGTLGGMTLNFYPTGLYTGFDFDCSSGTGIKFERYNGTTAYTGLSTFYLDNGYSIQKDNTNNLIYVPYSNAGAYVSINALITGGTTLVSSHVGSSTKHNLFPSMIRFTPAFFDRSDATIWTDAARLGFYDSNNKKDFHISEINFKTLCTFTNDSYRGRFYPKFTTNSIDVRSTMDELILHTTDKKGIPESKVLIYTNDIKRTQKDVNNAYIVDTDGYLVMYLAEELGGDPITNYVTLQAAINAGNVTIGTSTDEIMLISQPIRVPSNRTLTVNCELKIKNASYANLTANVTVLDTVINVDSVTGFHVGEYIAISDNLLAVQGGSTQTRRVASCGIITDITGLAITIDKPSKYNVSAASGGKIGHCQSVIDITSKANVTISGIGIINGNRYNQYDVEAVNATQEATEFGSTINVFTSTNVKILSSSLLTVKDAVLHNIAYWGVTSTPEIGNVLCQNAHDKNILCASVEGIHIHNVKTDGTSFEDGIIFYSGNTNMLVEDVESINSARAGISVLANSICNGVFNRIKCGSSLRLRSSNIVLTDVEMIGNAYLLIDTSYTHGNDIQINGISFANATTPYLIGLQGAIHDIEINDFTADGCNTSTAAIVATDYGGGGLYPQNVDFIGGSLTNHTGTKTAINASADVVFTDFVGIP